MKCQMKCEWIVLDALFEVKVSRSAEWCYTCGAIRLSNREDDIEEPHSKQSLIRSREETGEVEAEDAQALLDHIRLGCPDLVVLDWELPGMPAMELLGAIRKACSHLWVVLS